MRIAKFISNAGYCSRRDAEKLISKKRVYINKKICDAPNINIVKNDQVTIDGKIIKLNKIIRLWKMYKPTNVICTNNDPKKRKTIFELLPKNMPRTISIGRLDFMSEGLILLTNNGDFARQLELPRSNIIRIYRVCLATHVKNEDLKKINYGLSINGILYNKIEATLEKINQKKSWLKFKLREGKNREIRNICRYFKWPILKLIRLQYGPVKINKEKPGQIVEIDLKSYNFK